MSLIGDIAKRLRPGSGGPVESYSRTLLDDYDEKLHRRGAPMPPGVAVDAYARSYPIAGSRMRERPAVLASQEEGRFDSHQPDDAAILNKLFGIRA